MAQTRVAVVGVGFGASVVVPGFRRVAGVEVVALASAHLGRARNAAERLNVAGAFDDFDRLLDEADPDLVAITPPPHLHYPMVMEAVRRGKHVICEKPFALDLPEARAMLAAAGEAGVVHAVDHEFRYLPAREGLRQLLGGGYVGEPRLVHFESCSPRAATAEARPFTWWMEREMGGGILGAAGSHYFDALRWWLETEAVAASGELRAFVPERNDANGTWRHVTADDSCAGLLKMENGVLVTFCLTIAAGQNGSRVEVHGTEGTLVMEDDRRLLGGRRGSGLEELPLPDASYPQQAGEHHLIGAFASLAHLVVKAAQGQPAGAYPTFRDGAAVQAMMDAMARSSQERREVMVEPL